MKSISEFEKEHDVRLIKKTDSIFMRLIGFFCHVFGNYSFMGSFWTTYRLPFQKRVTITYPIKVIRPTMHEGILNHELVHVKQLRWFGAPLVMGLLYILLPLPILCSGRWWIERRAFLVDILAGRRTIDQCVDLLWRSYGWCWPRFLMRRWFNAAALSKRD